MCGCEKPTHGQEIGRRNSVPARYTVAGGAGFGASSRNIEESRDAAAMTSTWGERRSKREEGRLDTRERAAGVFAVIPTISGLRKKKTHLMPADL